jgi:TatD DNase family protein
MRFIDTHIHIDGEEFDEDRDLVIERARMAGACKLLLPAINWESVDKVVKIARQYPGVVYPMIGLHPEEVKDDFEEVLANMKMRFSDDFIAIGEVGLDFYWSRDFQQQQLEAFRQQVEWACEVRLPLMIHCRKAQNEMVQILRQYEKKLAGGVFHCFTGNATEAEQLLRFDGFALGIGGVLTFKKSHLPEVVKSVPLSRIVLETDAPYMAPVPMRGKRNESAFLTYVIGKLADCYAITEEEIAECTTNNALEIFKKIV